MGMQQARQTSSETSGRGNAEQAVPEFPVREYIAAMALELAQMARWDGDEALGRILNSAATLANEPMARRPVEVAEPTTPRPA